MVLLAGCAAATDDGAPRPTRTVTVTATPSVAAAPEAVPVGDGDVSPADVVWAQGSVLHVDDRTVDLAPVEVEAFVVVDGGVFVLADTEVWFTDLARVRGTGLSGVSALGTDAAASVLGVVGEQAGRPLRQGYDARTGRAVPGEVATAAPERLRAGPGRYTVRTSPAGVPVVTRSPAGPAVRLRDAPRSFEVGGWAGESVVYGAARASDGRRQVVGCDLEQARCRVLESVAADQAIVFGTGTPQ